MSRRAIIAVAVSAALACSLASCGKDAPQETPAEKLRVFVSIPPQAYFVERIGGQRVDVHVLLGPGQDPHRYEPPAKQIAELSSASVYFRIGMPFEHVLADKIAAGHHHLSIVQTQKGASDHAHQGEHALESDPHTWLAPRLVKGQAKIICDELCKLDPASKSLYEKNLRVFHAELDAVDTEIARTLAPVKGKTLYVFHPAFGHFAAAYGLKQQAVETGGKSPSLKHMKTLIDQAKADGAKVIFVQPQFSDAAARKISEAIGGAVIPMDPLARDYVSNLWQMANKCKQALESQNP